MSKTPEKPKKYEEQLMDTLSFDETDLEANEAGQLSAGQIHHLNSLRGQTLTMMAIFSVLCALLTAVIMGATIASWGALPAFIGGIAVLAGLFFGFGSKARRLLADMRNNQVAQVEGRVDLSLKTAQNNANYYLRVDKLRFPLKQAAFLAFKNGDPYRIYYAPLSKQILAVEWLRENDDNLRDDADSASSEMPHDMLMDDADKPGEARQG